MLLDHHYHSAPDLLLRLRRRVRQRLRLQQWLRLQQRLRLLSIDTSYTKGTARERSPLQLVEKVRLELGFF